MVSQCQEGEEPVLVTNRLQTNPSAQSPWPLLRGGLIVSCQAPAGTPIDDPAFIRAQALTVELAGACAIRAEMPSIEGPSPETNLIASSTDISETTPPRTS